MFKKTLVAAALIAVGFNATAATVTASGDLISVEGTATGSAIPLATVLTTQALSASASYSSFNGVSLALSGASFNPASSLTLQINDASGNGNATDMTNGDVLVSPTDFAVTFTTASRAQIVINATGLGKLDLTATGLADPATAATFKIAGVVINDADITSQSTVTATVELDSNIPGTDIETGSAKIATGVTQFDANAGTANVTKIDVADDRKQFDAAGAAALVQTFTSVAKSAVANVRAADASSLKITTTVKGDFTWLDADSDGKVDTGVGLSAVASSGTLGAVTYATNFLSATVVNTLPGTYFDGVTADTETLTWTLTTDGTREIPVGAITSDVSFPYTVTGSSNGTFTENGNTAANFTLNGDSGYISFMPFGSDFSQSVTITNQGTVDGIITVDWFYDGAKVTTVLDITAAPLSVTDISGELREKALAAGITGNAALNIVVNSPSDNIRIDALYYSKSDLDRGVVAVDQN